MTKTTRRNKCKTHTPIVLALSPAQHQALKVPPRLSLKAFKDLQGTATDWYNIAFRLKTAAEIATRFYEDAAALEVVLTLETAMEVMKHHKETGRWYATPAQIEILEAGLDAMDELQHSNARRYLLEASYLARTFMTQFVG